MLPKAHLTSHSRTSGPEWETTPLWLSVSLRSSFYIVLLCIRSICSWSLLLLLNLYCFCPLFAHLWMKCSFDISTFLEEDYSFTLSVVFLCFFALFIEECLLVSPCYSLELWLVRFTFCFPPCFSLLLFPQLFVKPPQTITLPSCIPFFLGMVLFAGSCTILHTSVHSFSGTLY